MPINSASEDFTQAKYPIGNSFVKLQRVSSSLPQPSSAWIFWLTLIGIFMPYTFGTTGKYVVVPLFVPATLAFFSRVARRQRHLLASDYFAWATALWMIATKLDKASLWFAGSDALAFVGSYMIARAFFYGKSSLNRFAGVFRIIAISLIALSALDTMSGQYFIHDLMAAIFNQRPPRYNADIHRDVFGINVLRAASTFAHPILYGSFCSVAAAIFLYSERNVLPRLFYLCACVMGCFLSLSSGPLLAIAIVISVYCYDRLLSRYSGRWKALWIAVLVSVGALFLLSNRPVGFLISNFTLTPGTGYWRVMIWDHAFNYIALSPFVGADSIAWSADDVLSDSVDSVWLALSLGHGLPIVLFILCATLTACGLFGARPNIPSRNFGVQRMRTGFSLALSMFVFIGLTVHFWDAMWMFWGLCIGIRVSLEEYCLTFRELPPPSNNLIPRHRLGAFSGT